MKRIVALAMIACLLPLGGCRRGVSSNDTHSLEPNKLKVVDLPAARRIQVDFATKDKVPVTAILVTKEDADAALESVGSKGDIEAALKGIKNRIAIRMNLDSGTLNSPKTSAKVQYSVLFTTAKATTVTVKTSGDR